MAAWAFQDINNPSAGYCTGPSPGCGLGSLLALTDTCCIRACKCGRDMPLPPPKIVSECARPAGTNMGMCVGEKTVGSDNMCWPAAPSSPASGPAVPCTDGAGKLTGQQCLMYTFDNPKTQKPDPKRQIGICCDVSKDNPNPMCRPAVGLSASLAPPGPLAGDECAKCVKEKCAAPPKSVGGVVRWSFKTGGEVLSPPALSPDGSTVFVGSFDKNVYALSAADGSKKWSFATGGHVYSSPALSADGSTVFFGSDDKCVYALSAADGSKKWVSGSWGVVASSPALSADGSTVFVGSRDNSVYALSAADGSKKWSFATGYMVMSSPALSPDGSTVFVGSNDKSVYALSAADGSKKWSFATGDDVWSSPALSPDGSTVFVGSDDHSVYALSAADGSKKWSFAMGDHRVESSPALSPDGSTVFIGFVYDKKNDREMYALNALSAADGSKKWRFGTANVVFGSAPAVSPDGSTVFLATLDLYALTTGL
jgi:outer membrane protein assembly factor BamB